MVVLIAPWLQIVTEKGLLLVSSSLRPGIRPRMILEHMLVITISNQMHHSNPEAMHGHHQDDPDGHGRHRTGVGHQQPFASRRCFCLSMKSSSRCFSSRVSSGS